MHHHTLFTSIFLFKGPQHIPTGVYGQKPQTALQGWGPCLAILGPCLTLVPFTSPDPDSDLQTDDLTWSWHVLVPREMLNAHSSLCPPAALLLLGRVPSCGALHWRTHGSPQPHGPRQPWQLWSPDTCELLLNPHVSPSVLNIHYFFFITNGEALLSVFCKVILVRAPWIFVACITQQL